MRTTGEFTPGLLEPAIVRPEDSAHVKLYRKLVAVMKVIDTIEKRGEYKKDGEVKYKYYRADDVLSAVHEEMVKQNLLLKKRIISHERWSEATRSGGTLNYCQVVASFRWIDAETGATEEFDGIGWGMDSGDKAPQKATGAALKYSLRDDLLFSDDSTDGDLNHAEAERGRRKTKEEKRQYETITGNVTEYSRLSEASLFLMVNGIRIRAIDPQSIAKLKDCQGRRVELNAFWDRIGTKGDVPCMTISSVIGIYELVPGETQYVPLADAAPTGDGIPLEFSKPKRARA